MFDHVSIGVADIARSKKFYDAALRPLGFSLLKLDVLALEPARHADSVAHDGSRTESSFRR